MSKYRIHRLIVLLIAALLMSACATPSGKDRAQKYMDAAKQSFAAGSKDLENKDFKSADAALTRSLESLEMSYKICSSSPDCAVNLKQSRNNRANIFAKRALARLGTGNLAGAKADADATLKYDSKDWRGHFVLGLAAIVEKDRTAFRRALAAIKAKNPKEAKAIASIAKKAKFRF